MTTCPKCGHAGQNADSCEKCGIIFDRMHTVLEVRPLGAGPQPPARGASAIDEAFPGARLSAARPVAAPPLERAPERTLAPGSRPAAETTRPPTVPLVPRTAQSRRLPWLLGTLAVVLVLWGLSEWRERRSEQIRVAPTASASVRDAAYFELALESALADARRDLVRPADPARAQATRARLALLVPGLVRELATAPVDSVRRDSLGRSLAALGRFLQAPAGQGDPAALAEADGALAER